MQYFPMTDIVKKFSNNQRFAYNVVVNLYTRKDEKDDYINKNVRICSNENISEEELIQRATNVVYGLIDSKEEFGRYDQVKIVGIAFAGAYDRDLK
ncbi:hypothetical protein SAMN05428961_1108 [Paenibacillus sp. OK060]|uniref:hypothetical protein n=1 Tax=Paenibacillus sp. OK060 TaxID=1881034 RepID=UPI000882D8BF|nr:hypothetical protein [Paenibacillus sp. OK060]SDM13435.1 hypothetical protein SAMN05428961_1108 [Paenibacillus sp. OK060]